MEVDFLSLRVLVVDDDPAIVKLLRMLLLDFGVTKVTLAKSGKEAQEVLQNRGDEIDFIICDWNMPDVSGMDLLKWVRASDPDLPFIFITSRGDLNSVEAARAQGVTDYLLKPFKSENLRQKLILHAAKVPLA